MKNTILWSTLFALVGTQVHADLSQPATTPTQTPTVVPGTPDTPPTQAQSLPSINVLPAPAPDLNCEYKIPASTKTVDQTLVIAWSKKAVEQAFNFDPTNLDMQLQKLQSCFTEQGWTGFNTALQKSGNLDAIKSQKLTVSSQVEGAVVVTDAKDNQWKINLPLQVVYQNDKEKVTQLLSVDLTVGRKITGDLGITQMIAAPRAAVTQQQPQSTPTTNNTTASPSPTSDQAPSTSTTTTPQPTSTDNQTTKNPATVEQPASSGTQPTTPNPTPSGSGNQPATTNPTTPGQSASPNSGSSTH